jgi:hypothetical protein
VDDTGVFMRKILLFIGFSFICGVCFSQDQDVNFHSLTAQQLEEKLIQIDIDAESKLPSPPPTHEKVKQDFDFLADSYCYGEDKLLLNQKPSNEKLKDELRQDYLRDSDSPSYVWNYKTGKLFSSNETKDRAFSTLLKCEFFAKYMLETFKTDKKSIELYLKKAENYYLKNDYPRMSLNLIAGMSLAHPLTKNSVNKIIAQAAPKNFKY